MIKDKRWVGYDENQWSGKKREEKWFPHFTEDLLLGTYKDSTNAESMSIYLQYNYKTGRIHRIKNIGVLSNKSILIRLKNKEGKFSWTREYVISPDKDGKDFSIIDLDMHISNFFIKKHEGRLMVDSDYTTVTISTEDI